MSPTATSTVKRTTRARKTAVSSAESSSVVKPIAQPKNLKLYEESFGNLLNAVNTAKEEFVDLQKEIEETKEAWVKEQKDHDILIQERNQQEEIVRKRENETYNYETTLKRRQQEDEFLEKKTKWEKELQDRKDEIAKEKEELGMLRKEVAGFEGEKEKAVKEAIAVLQKELQAAFATERKLREQEVKAEKELLALKITNLTQENTRQANEMTALKKSLENATAQLKDVAVKVIESSGPSAKTPVTTED